MKAHGKPKVKRLFKFFFSMCECAVGLGWGGIGNIRGAAACTGRLCGKRGQARACSTYQILY